MGPVTRRRRACSGSCRDSTRASRASWGPALLAGIEQHRAGDPPDDDVTLLVLAHNAEGPRRRSLGERFYVYAKVFGLKPF